MQIVPTELANPNKPQPITVDGKQIPRGLAETFMKYIRKGDMLDSVKESLQVYDTTIEKFMDACEKNGL